RGHWRRFAFGALVQGFAVLGGLHLLNPDAFIVRTNLARPAEHRPFDAAYAASLGADAVPDLLTALPRLEDAEQCRAARRLLSRWTPGGARAVEDGWRHWNLARARARTSCGKTDPSPPGRRPAFTPKAACSPPSSGATGSSSISPRPAPSPARSPRGSLWPSA